MNVRQLALVASLMVGVVGVANATCVPCPKKVHHVHHVVTTPVTHVVYVDKPSAPETVFVDRPVAKTVYVDRTVYKPVLTTATVNETPDVSLLDFNKRGSLSVRGYEQWLSHPNDADDFDKSFWVSLAGAHKLTMKPGARFPASLLFSVDYEVAGDHLAISDADHQWGVRAGLGFQLKKSGS